MQYFFEIEFMNMNILLKYSNNLSASMLGKMNTVHCVAYFWRSKYFSDK